MMKHALYRVAIDFEGTQTFTIGSEVNPKFKRFRRANTVKMMVSQGLLYGELCQVGDFQD